LKASTLQTTTRGFTDHEQIDAVGLIHMNGRMYDPTLGRFLSPDDYVQFPHASQSYNRYSYVLNNPASYQDPSGEIIPLVVGAVVLTYKAYNVYDTVTGGVEDVKTLMSDDASTTDKVLSGASLLGGVAGVPRWVRGIGGDLVTSAKKVNDKLSKSQVDVDVTASAKGGKNLADSAVTPEKALEKAADDGVKAEGVHSNSKLSQKAQHVYEIRNNKTGEVVKTGISQGKISKKGKSYRAERQRRKWGKDDFDTTIIAEIPAGPGARQKALDIEAANAAGLRPENLTNPDYHVRP
jgi:RHS repeat-associated protein